MNKFIGILKNNIPTSISIVAVIALLLSNTYFVVQAQEGDTGSQIVGTEQELPETKSLTPEQLINLDVQGTSASYPHLSCVQNIVRTTEPSDVYVPGAPYNLQFHGDHVSNNFQDVNGDNLPDYVYAANTVNGGTNLIQTYQACVYLNNGAGWTKAYECYATTHTTAATGEITIAQYYGDCAGEPSAQQEN